MANTLTFTAPPTISRFIQSKAPVRIIMGPFGGGKTSGMMIALLTNAIEQAPDQQGRRRTRFALVRNTLEQLRTTTLKTLLEWIPDGGLGSYKVSDKTLYLDFLHPSNDGTRVLSELSLLSLDTPDDSRRLLSLELTGVALNECREIHPEIVTGAIGRCNRYPNKKDWADPHDPAAGATFPCLIGDTNPPVIGSYWHKAIAEPPPGWETFLQPPAVLEVAAGQFEVNPLAENLDGLNDGYYEGLLVANAGNAAWIRTYLGNQFGRSMHGEPIFGKLFAPNLHLSDKPLLPEIAQTPIIVGLDFGLFPAALIGQHTARGQLKIFEEMTDQESTTAGFLEQQLLPALTQRYRGFPILLVGDPTGMMRSALAGGRNSFDLLKRMGIRAIPAPTNLIEPRLQAVERFMMGQVRGQGRLLIDAQCSTLVEALASEYRYRSKRSGDLQEMPDKTHPWSDVADCLQYMCLLAESPGLIARAAQLPRALNQRPADLRGWV